jgi:hypothetical protein
MGLLRKLQFFKKFKNAAATDSGHVVKSVTPLQCAYRVQECTNGALNAPGELWWNGLPVQERGPNPLRMYPLLFECIPQHYGTHSLPCTQMRLKPMCQQIEPCRPTPQLGLLEKHAAMGTVIHLTSWFQESCHLLQRRQGRGGRVLHHSANSP